MHMRGLSRERVSRQIPCLSANLLLTRRMCSGFLPSDQNFLQVALAEASRPALASQESLKIAQIMEMTLMDLAFRAMDSANDLKSTWGKIGQYDLALRFHNAPHFPEYLLKVGDMMDGVHGQDSIKSLIRPGE